MTNQDEPDAEAGEPVPDADAPADPVPSIARGGPKAFLLLTCGFLVLLCCVGGCLGGSGLGFLRARALDETRVTVGAPAGWAVEEHSAWPWAAYARLSGPADAAAVTGWLAGLGAEPETSEVDGCLSPAATPCTLEFSVGERTIAVEYGPESDAAYAEVTVT